jgi:hypothetical protein
MGYSIPSKPPTSPLQSAIRISFPETPRAGRVPKRPRRRAAPGPRKSAPTISKYFYHKTILLYYDFSANARAKIVFFHRAGEAARTHT